MNRTETAYRNRDIKAGRRHQLDSQTDGGDWRKPILWHIMKTYSHYGIKDFIICCGYKQYVIKEYFANYFRHNSDMTVDLSNNSATILDNHSEDWKVTMVDTRIEYSNRRTLEKGTEVCRERTFPADLR